MRLMLCWHVHFFDDAMFTIKEIFAYQYKVAAGRGLVTSVSFLAAPYLALPASVCFAWVSQARLAGAVAKVYGYDIESPKVRSMIMCTYV